MRVGNHNDLSPLTAVLNIFQHYIDLPLLLHPSHGRSEWLLLHRHRRRISIGDIQNNYGLMKKRQAYDRRLFRSNLKNIEPRLGEFEGAWDMAVPVIRNSRAGAFLVTGPFFRQHHDEASLQEMWKKMSGRAADPLNPDYLYMVREVLDTPVLDDQTVAALKACLQLLAEDFAGRGSASAHRNRIDTICNKVISARLLHIYWAQRALRTDKQFKRAMVKGVLNAWEKEVFNINREPTRVLAAAVEGPAGSSQVAHRALGARFRRSMPAYLHAIPDSTGGDLGDNGVFILTSTPPGKKAELDLRDKVEALEQWVRRNLKARLRVGIGRDVKKVDDLALSYNEAVDALHHAALNERSVFFYSRPKVGDGTARAAADLGREWAAAEMEGRKAGAGNLLSRFLAGALTESAQQVAPLRVYLVHALHEFGRAVERRAVTSDQDWNKLAAQLRIDLNQAPSVEQVLKIFREWHQRLLGFLAAPGQTHRRLRLLKAQAFVDENYRQSVSLGEVARAAGLSSTSLSRHFPSVAGKAFERYLLDKRMDQAKGLLRATRLSASHISDDCGFKSRNYFFQCFKREVGLSPMEYRNGNQT